MFHYIRLISKRDKNLSLPKDTIVVDIDRTNPILGNPFVLSDSQDDDERQYVIDSYRDYFNTEFNKDGKLTQAVYSLVDIVKQGGKLALRCWCHPMPCHGSIIIDKINTLLGSKMSSLSTYKQVEYDPNTIDYVECRFATFIPKKEGGEHDYHMAKEVIHFKDGTTKPNIRIWPDYKQKYWVTKSLYRKRYSQKKEWEYMNMLDEIESTQSDLSRNLALALGKPRLANRFFDLKNEPHVFGLDIPSTVGLKYEYSKKMQGRPETPFKTAFSDTETNMVDLDRGASKHIIMQSLYFDRTLYTVILKDFLRKVHNPEASLREMYDVYMPQQGKDLVDKWEIEFVDTPFELVKRILNRCHELKPDFLTFWNMLFDIEKMISAIEDAGYDPQDLFSDPSLPPEMRHFFLKKAKPTKTSASGRTMSKKPADQWHTINTPASFYIVDMMASYRFIRKSKQLETSYALDHIFSVETPGLSKLRIPGSEGLEKEQFHIVMQEKFPVEYTIYHAWDAVGLSVLNEKTKDLSFSLPGSTGISNFETFESEPKRYIHNFHYYILENHDAVTGCAGKSLVQDFDNLTISTKGHIVTLEPHLTVDNGLCIFSDYPDLQTSFRAHCGDLDVKSSYPYGQWGFNMSRTTCVRELISIEGIREEQRRLQGLNLSGGATNGIEFSTEIFKVPTLMELSKLYDEMNAGS